MAGEEPCASARMRCFIVGGSALSRGRVHRTEGVVAVAAVAPVCSWTVAAGCAAAAVVLMRPREARTAKKAVTKAVQRLLTLKALMAPHFQVFRLSYLSDDLDPGPDCADRRPRCADLRMNTTPLAQPGSKSCFQGWKTVRMMLGSSPGSRCPWGSRQVTDRSRPVCIVGRQQSPYAKERRGRAVKKLLLVALAAIGGLLVYRQIQADRAEQDLWTEATDSVPAGSGV